MLYASVELDMSFRLLSNDQKRSDKVAALKIPLEYPASFKTNYEFDENLFPRRTDEKRQG